MKYAQVIVDIASSAVDRVFTYRVPEGLDLQRGMRVGCTACGYCQPCPKGVDIPTCFAAYNTSYAENLVAGMREYMMCTTLRKVRSNAGLCVKCGRCEQHCPQHIAIREELDGVRRRLENPVYKVAAKLAPKILKY